MKITIRLLGIAGLVFVGLSCDKRSDQPTTPSPQAVPSGEGKDKLAQAQLLDREVPVAWRSLRSDLLRKSVNGTSKIGEARQQVARMDVEILDRLAGRFACGPNDIHQAWERRERLARKVTMDDGSWIFKGGQDGGVDCAEGAGVPSDDSVDEFVRRFGDSKQKKGATGKSLETSEEWWSRAFPSKRIDWLEAEYALTSPYVRTETKEEKCSTCQGAGTLTATRSSKTVNVICPRCHKTGVDVVVTYW